MKYLTCLLVTVCIVPLTLILTIATFYASGCDYKRHFKPRGVIIQPPLLTQRLIVIFMPNTIYPQEKAVVYESNLLNSLMIDQPLKLVSTTLELLVYPFRKRNTRALSHTSFKYIFGKTLSYQGGGYYPVQDFSIFAKIPLNNGYQLGDDYDVTVTSYLGCWYLFWYVWKEETHDSYTMVPIRCIQGFHFQIHHGGGNHHPW